MPIAYTSRLSYRDILPKSFTDRRMIFDYINNHPGLTRGELSEHLNFREGAVCGRVSELLKMGLLEEGLMRPNTAKYSGGKNATTLYARSENTWEKWQAEQDRKGNEQMKLEI